MSIAAYMYPPEYVYIITLVFAVALAGGIVLLAKAMRERVTDINPAKDYTSMSMEELFQSIQELCSLLQTSIDGDSSEIKNHLHDLRDGLIQLTAHLPMKSSEIQNYIDKLAKDEDELDNLPILLMEIHQWIDAVRVELASL
ncbi:MAG: hypothetical protein AAF984_01645 [Verrucomicrobiota bacterium]